MLELQCVFCVFMNVLCLSPAAGPTVKPSVSLLPPSSLQISGESAALLLPAQLLLSTGGAGELDTGRLRGHRGGCDQRRERAGRPLQPQ